MLCLILGILSALCFETTAAVTSNLPSGLFSLYPLGDVIAGASLIGLFAIFLWSTCSATTRRQAFCRGYAYGLGLFAYGLNWIYISLYQFGGAPLGFALFANVGVILFLALYPALVAYLLHRLSTRTSVRLLLAPALWASLEWVRSVFLIGFPWLSLGYAHVDNALAHFASLGGVFAVSFISVALSALIATLILSRHRLRRRTWFIAGASVLTITLLLLGVRLLPNFMQDSGSLRLALLQGNIPVSTKFDADKMNDSLQRYWALTDAVIERTTTPNPVENSAENSAKTTRLIAKPKPIELIIWPETAIPFFDYEVTDMLGEIGQFQDQHQFDLISGLPVFHPDSQAVYNGMLLQSAKPKSADSGVPRPVNQFYYKSHLLAFGEYLPLRSVFAFFEDFVSIPMSDFSRGSTVQANFISHGLRLAPSICFEIVFGAEIAQNSQTAEALINISNDGWFGDSKAQIQHLNIARFRAIENQKYLARATNDGRSAIIDPLGRLQNTTPPFQASSIVGTIQGKIGQTPYHRLGDLPFLGSYLLIIIGLVGYEQRRRWIRNLGSTP